MHFKFKRNDGPNDTIDILQSSMPNSCPQTCIRRKMNLNTNWTKIETFRGIFNTISPKENISYILISKNVVVSTRD